jgi:uncharacterized protein (UPF0335 family)
MDVTQLDVGPLNRRLETAITEGQHAAIEEVMKDIGGEGFRSKAARHLLMLGAKEYARRQARKA